MEPAVRRQGQKWVIARKFQSNLISGTHANRIQYDVWSGKEWCGQHGYAKFFETEEEAQQYLDENRELEQ